MLRTFVLILSALCLAACGTRTAVERKGRIIRLTDAILDIGGADTVRFGRMHSGEIAVMQLWLANEASRPAGVLSYDRTCGCTTFEFDPQPIKPGDAQRVKLTFDSRGEQGWQLKVVDLNLVGGRKPLRIFVEAEVE